jgi:hypothetical protein
MNFLSLLFCHSSRRGYAVGHLPAGVHDREGNAMSFLSRLTNLVTRSGRDDNRLQQAMEHAESRQPAEAIAIYDSLIDAKGTSPTVRARALFNRALAHSSRKDDDKAVADLESVIVMPGTPENVLAAARNQLVRVRNRVLRARERTSK